MKKHFIFSLFIVLTIVSCGAKSNQDKSNSEAYLSFPTLDELGADWIEVSTLRNFPSVMNFIGGLQSTQNITAFQHLTLPPFAQSGGRFYWDESITTDRLLSEPMKNWSCELLVNEKSAISADSKWLPYEVQRKATIEDVEMHSFMRMPFEQKGVLIQLVLQNKTSESKSFKLSMNTYGHVRSYPEEEWRTWGNRRPYDDDFTATVAEDKKAVIITDKSSPAVVSYYFVNKPEEIFVSNDKGEAKWNISLAPGEEKTMEFVYVVGNDKNAVAKEANEWGKNFENQFSLAKSKWEERWLAAFTPGNSHFSGHYPTLLTDDPKIRRVYYHGTLIPLLLCRTNFPLSQRCYVTAGPRWANSLVYFWDAEMWANTLAMLDPDIMKEHIVEWFSVDYHNCYAIECFTGKGAGPWYAANDWSIFRTIEAYLEVSGDKKFLDQDIYGKTLLQHLNDIATFYESRPLTEGSLLTNYGTSANLLECSPSYIQGVPALNAANVYMLRKTAEYNELMGKKERAKDLKMKAERLLPVILSLYEPGEGVWSAMDDKGNKVPIRHCFDYVVIGQALENDLSPQVKMEMNRFVDTELRTRTWMRAMSLKDPAAVDSDRPDHGPLGCYPAWPPMTMDVMCRFGEFDKATDFLRTTEELTYQGPWAQAHEFLGPDSRGYDPIVRTASRGGQDANEGCGAAFAETVIRAFFGLRPELSKGKKPVLLSPETPRGFNGELKHVSHKGDLYTIISSENGLKIVDE